MRMTSLTLSIAVGYPARLFGRGWRGASVCWGNRQAERGREGRGTVNWAAGLYAGGIWMLAAGIWSLVQQAETPEMTRTLAVQVARDTLPALLLAVLMARLL